MDKEHYYFLIKVGNSLEVTGRVRAKDDVVCKNKSFKVLSDISKQVNFNSFHVRLPLMDLSDRESPPDTKYHSEDESIDETEPYQSSGSEFDPDKENSWESSTSFEGSPLREKPGAYTKSQTILMGGEESSLDIMNISPAVDTVDTGKRKMTKRRLFSVSTELETEFGLQPWVIGDASEPTNKVTRDSSMPVVEFTEDSSNVNSTNEPFQPRKSGLGSSKFTEDSSNVNSTNEPFQPGKSGLGSSNPVCSTQRSSSVSESTELDQKIAKFLKEYKPQEKEELMSLEDGYFFYKTPENAHKRDVLVPRNSIDHSKAKSTTLCKGGNECVLEMEELVVTREVNDRLDIHLQFMNCVGPGFYVGKERRIGTLDVAYLHRQKETGNNGEPVKRKPSRESTEKKGKKAYCIFCSKGLHDLTHHLKRVHSSEDKVKEALSFPSKSVERRRALQKLKNLGNREYEAKVSTNNMIGMRRTATLGNSSYLRCAGCDGCIVHYNYARHVRKCRQLPSNYRRHASEARTWQDNKISDTDAIYKTVREEVLAPMRNDEMSEVISADVALQAYADYYCMSSKTTTNKAKNVRAQLRLLARLLLTIQSLDPFILSFVDVLNLRNYSLLILGVMSLIKFNTRKQTIDKSATSLVLKSCLQNLARALMFYYKKKPDETIRECDVKTLEDFMDHFGSKYTEDIAKPAYEHKANMKALKQYEMPSNRDIAMFARFVEKAAEEAYTDLNDKFTYNSYLKLGRSMLIKLMLFNRRRIGEMSRLNLQCYMQREAVSPEIREHMNPIEKHLANNLFVVKLVGKKKRVLTILISKNDIIYLDKLISLRADVSIPEDNLYLFATPNATGYIDASSAIRKFANDCGASEPEKLRATLFRKQVATMAQMMHLTDNEIQQLADFMGHEVEVHKEHYRKNCNYQQIAVLSRLFLALEAGDIGLFKNKTLAEVEVILNKDLPFYADNEAHGVPNMLEMTDDATSGSVESSVDDQTYIDIATVITTAHHSDIAEPNEVNISLPSSSTDSTLTREESPPSTSQKISSQVTPTKSPRTRLKRIMMGTPVKTPIKKKICYSKAELVVLRKYLDPLVAKGMYPKNQKIFFQRILEQHKDVFHKKRTPQSLFSYCQNGIRKFRQKQMRDAQN